MKKRFLSTLLALCMVLTLLPGTVWAEGSPEDGTVPLDAELTLPDSLSNSEERELEDISSFDNDICYDDIIPLEANADTSATSGTCGENLIWNFDANSGSLIISGTGPMEDYDGYWSTPWYKRDYDESIISIVIEDGVTTIGNYAFSDIYYMNNRRVTSVTIPSTVTNWGVRF